MLRKFLVAGNLWVGLSVAGLSLLSFAMPWSPIAYLYAAFLLFATASAYSYMRWVKLIKGNPSRQPVKAISLENENFTLGYTLGMAVIAVALFKIIYTWSLMMAMLPAVVVALLYPLAFPNPNRYFSSLRSIPMLKLLLISLSWSWLSYGLPVLISGGFWDVYASAELIFRMLFIAGLTIPFDIRDLRFDDQKMKTIPQIFGIDTALVLSNICLLLYQIWNILAYFNGLRNLETALAWLIGIELGAWMIRQIKTKQSDRYISFWIEAIPIFVFLLFLLFQFGLGHL
jgi:hypothetical protein